MLVKTKTYVGEFTNMQFHTYSLTYYFINIRYTNITALLELHVGQTFSPTSFNNIGKASQSTVLTLLILKFSQTELGSHRYFYSGFRIIIKDITDIVMQQIYFAKIDGR